MSNIATALHERIESLSKEILDDKKHLDDALALFINSPVSTIERDQGSIDVYKYFLYPFKGTTLVNHAIYEKISHYLADLIPKDTEVIVSIESDGIGVASFIGAKLGLPVVICKTYHYGEDCTPFIQKAGYHERTMYLPKAIKGKQVAVVDCMISTGGTIRAMLEAIKSISDTSIAGVYCINNKTNYGEQKDTFEGHAYNYVFNTWINKEDKVEATITKDITRIFWEHIDKKFFELAKNSAQLSNFSKNGYQVGALIVAADTFEIVAHGYRRGNIHAEHDAITMMKHNCPDWEKRNFTLYTTLEPCTYRNGNGYTSCSQLINDIPQIRWVVVGRCDKEDDIICGNGLKTLNKHKHIRLIETGEILRCPNDVPHII
ncbi:MAG: hypothetical protein HOE80_04845 [Candidatus Magasanikbacteria bacterium]|jgi:adenine phosphoribosyltransferase|nr:hypothetical protein [Candidatus Magasanikbacteria bacterium]MBT4072017.1 hypothetical protein [Candidatus Magasanikbacteria bacterium]